jgi:ATP-binding cassette subfamily B multidrug efflux pump
MFAWFEKRVDPFPEGPLDVPPKTLFAFCRHYTEGAWPSILVMAALTSGLALLEVWLMSFVGNIVDWLSERSPETLFAEEGKTLAFMAAVVVVVLPAIAFVNALISHQSLLGNYPMRIRWKVHRYLLGQSMSYFQHEFSGRVATKLMQTALAVRESVLKVLDVLNYVAVYFVGVLVIAAAADLRLLVPFALWGVAYLGLLRYFIPRLRVASEKQADARSTMTGRIVDSYTNIATVKLFSHSAREESYARESMQSFLQTVYSQMRLVTGFWVGLYFMNSLLLASVAATALYLWSNLAITVGAVAVGISMVVRIQSMSQWIMWEVSALFENIGTVEDGIASISLPQVVRDQPDAKPLVVSKGSITFDNVAFHYGKGEGVLDAVTLRIAPGERVGIVGRSGAGKSTLVNLLLRFFDVESGRIEIDDQDIARVTQDSLRAGVGVVTQDTSLLHRSVRENILYGRPDATDAELVAAAQEAEAHEFIEKLEDKAGRKGYEAHVGERGVMLSGGQRQRIAIARVMLKNAKILVLDEATSALDSEVEAAIQESLDKLMANKTVIAIAHRLSTIAALDRLVVLDQGRIVEGGTHAELVARGGLYAQLWARQSGGFLGHLGSEPSTDKNGTMERGPVLAAPST